MADSDTSYYSRVKALKEEKGRILDTSAELFSRYGYFGVTLDDIAKELHLNKITIYHYWHSKQDLYYEILLRANKIVLEDIKKIAKAGKSPDIILQNVVKNYVLNQITHPVPTTENLKKEYSLTNKHRSSLIKIRDQFDQAFQQIISDGMRDGMFIRGNPKMMNFAIIGVMNYVIHWYSPGGPLSKTEIVKHMTDFIMSSVLSSDLRKKYFSK
jgi:AcrR family transcriptional regulator